MMEGKSRKFEDIIPLVVPTIKTEAIDNMIKHVYKLFEIKFML